MIAKNIQLVRQGEYLSSYKINYFDEKTLTIKPYEIVSKQGSKYNNSEPLTLDTLGHIAPAVVMIVFNPDHTKMLLTKEFRLGINDWIYNPTAGLIDEGETAEEAAKRELFEETGLTLTKIVEKLPNAYSCAPVTDECVPTFICEATGDIRESDNSYELIEANWYSKEKVLKIVLDEKNNFSGRAQAFAYMWAKDFN